jgi:hypothetical protein
MLALWCHSFSRLIRPCGLRGRSGDEAGTQAASAGSVLGGLGSSSELVRVDEPDNFRLICMVDLLVLAKRLCRARFNEPGAAQAIFVR